MQGLRDVAVRFFVDLHLCPDLKDHEKTRRMIEKLAELGYDAVGVALPPEFSKEEAEEIRGICGEVGLDFISRVDLEPLTANELLRMLRRLRRRVEIIAVKCPSKAVARQAAKDMRVDLLSFSPLDLGRRFFDSAEAELASKASASLEFDLAPLIYLHGYRRVRLISKMREEALTARRFGVPIVLSSGADDAGLLRKPEDYSSLGYLFDLGMDEAKRAMSEIPKEIIERNRRKLSPDYVAPGIRVVRRGENCSGGRGGDT